MKPYVYIIIFPLLFLASCASTAEFPDPDTLPYRLEEVSWPLLNVDQDVLFTDLNGDGRDEMVHWSNRLNGPANVQIRTIKGYVIEQVNFPGRVLRPHILDYERNGIFEILVPYVRQDSLFVGFLDARGQKLFHFFIINGSDREEEDGVISEWDPDIKFTEIIDLDGDGNMQLLTVVCTGYAGLPRGVLIHSLPDGRQRDRLIIGGYIQHCFLSDFDSDNRLELVVKTSAPDNQAVAGGFDDRHAYLIVFELNPALRVEWEKELGGQYTRGGLFYEDFDGDGKKEFLNWTWIASGRPKKVVLEILEPEPWRISRNHSLAFPFLRSMIIDLDSDIVPEILTFDNQGSIWVLDHNFKLLQRRQFTSQVYLEMMDDVDGDDIAEIIVKMPDGVVLLDPGLNVKAAFPGESITSTMREGVGLPYLIGWRNQKPVVLSLKPNRFYLFFRYGPSILWIFGVVGIMGIGAFGMRLWQRRYHPQNQTASADIPRAEIWSKMAQRISHDMKSPLSGMLLTLQQLQGEYQKTVPDHACRFDPYVEQIMERIEYLRRMSRDFMKFVDTEKPHLVPTDFNAFIKDIGSYFEQSLPSDITLSLHRGDNLPTVEMDQEQIHSVLENLVSNSVNAMPDGGRITLVTDMARDLQLSFGKNASHAPRDYVTLEVRDTGVGIAPEYVPLLFSAGFTTSEQGTGLGLVLVHKIATDHEGHVEIESEVNKGTIVTIYLPMRPS